MLLSLRSLLPAYGTDTTRQTSLHGPLYLSLVSLPRDTTLTPTQLSYRLVICRKAPHCARVPAFPQAGGPMARNGNGAGQRPSPGVSSPDPSPDDPPRLLRGYERLRLLRDLATGAGQSQELASLARQYNISQSELRIFQRDHRKRSQSYQAPSHKDPISRQRGCGLPAKRIALLSSSTRLRRYAILSRITDKTEYPGLGLIGT